MGCLFQIRDGQAILMADQCGGNCTAPEPAQYQNGAMVFVECN